MSTTAIFAEILVSGLLAGVWLLMAALALSEPGDIDWDAIQKWQALATLAATAACYALGVLVDRIADSFFTRLRRASASDKALKSDSTSVSMMRLTVMAKSKELTSFLEYIRSRMRVARTTALNLIFVAAAGAWLAVSRGRFELVWPIVVGGAVLIIACWYANSRIAEAYDKRVKEAYAIVTSSTGDAS